MFTIVIIISSLLVMKCSFIVFSLFVVVMKCSSVDSSFPAIIVILSLFVMKYSSIDFRFLAFVSILTYLYRNNLYLL